MRVKPMILLSAGVVLAMLLAAYLVGIRLPETMVLPIHWNVDGKADGFAGKWTALCVAPAMTAAVSVLLATLPAIDPLRDGLNRSASLYRAAWIGLLALMAVTQTLPIGTALGWHFGAPRLHLAAIGLFLIVLGNLMPKSRPSRFVGIRTPWTLASTDVWIATHRLGGRLMMAAGAIWVVAALIGRPLVQLHALMIVGIAVAAIVPALWSYVLWRRETGRSA
ncbi:SdpI family protein [Sphingomonas nostoxanthinifaciens]|uniref:SdpI family protein n=1 Tax=Sphingomonas nostoxanthinifaciens TaxID=2872652 RepID=UPI001CC21C92|nr:SdpI family protein [Sphingomonas nostoxanthinifaciens]UAK24122.1 SdpI family protein [Sphingomonas nostoxanthinifaciens]